MAVFLERGSAASEAEPVGSMTEGAAGIAVVVLAVIGLANVSSEMLASIVTIVIAMALMVEACNAAAIEPRALTANPGAAAPKRMNEIGGRAMVDLMVGLTGLVLGILAVLGINATHLIPSALIVFGGGLLLSGIIGIGARQTIVRGENQTPTLLYPGPAGAASGFGVLVGLAAIVLGILSLTMVQDWVLSLVGFIAVGAALLMTSAASTGSVLRLFTATS